jgi:GT2 family glycosyltransferase
MQLSIVIVNYNVKYFLEQCLVSVKQATANIAAEIFVVDNASVDGSVELVKTTFPFVKLIANEKNVGFSKANNQAIEMATGKYILLLNPDTVVAEDTFEKCLDFMETHTDAGALGVRMIDGKGNFLPESKRGLPTPSVAFFKTFGFAKFFPKSKIFGRYHLGFLSEHETHEVDVLSGAFMFMRKGVIDNTGLLDETFFMYGEDVDLSYRITKEGFKNFYFPETTIIHYKGESTKKGSLNYVRVFYNAMSIFAKKHFSQNQSGLFSLLINFAIVFRGFLTLLSGLFASSYLFIVDALLSFAGIFFIKTYWENMIKYSENYYPNQFLFIVVPAYILVWIFFTFLNGGYDKPFRISNIFRGIFVGTIFIAVLYAFIPNEWRFSRAMILLGAMWTGFEMIFTRTLYHLLRFQSLSFETDKEERVMIVGKDDAARAQNIFRSLGNAQELILSDELETTAKKAAIHGVNELIFCSTDFSFKEIIAQITACGNGIDYKILSPGSDALIGSNSKDGAGDLYVAEKSYALFKPENIRKKRIFDLTACTLLLALLPVNIFVIKNLGHFISNWIQVLFRKKSWVGLNEILTHKKFPHAMRGVLHPADKITGFVLSQPDLLDAELNYARYYRITDDIALIFKNYRNLGQ